jgi:predicted glycosyltransferase
MTKIWIDILNPSHALFFNSIYRDLCGNEVNITVRDRAETIQLMELFGIKYSSFGRDYANPTLKCLSIIYRTLNLTAKVPYFDKAISFESAMSVMTARLRRKKALLFCDNDIQFIGESQKTDLKMKIRYTESAIKSFADAIVIPKSCYDSFIKFIDNNKLITYKGYKEDIYIADFKPDPNFGNKIPFDDYVIVRPEALGSFYVKEKKSIVPELLKLLRKENVNVVYLPREEGDMALAKGSDVFIPKKALNGLDLSYYARATLTGSGTFARESACMGKPSVSFFPGRKLLSVDQQLVNEGKMLHSRDTSEIADYVLSSSAGNNGFERSKGVKKQVLGIINGLLKNE